MTPVGYYLESQQDFAIINKIFKDFDMDHAYALFISIVTGIMGDNISNGLEREIWCISNNVYHEARGESLLGKAAVAHVTMNRVRHGDYPDNICDVVYQAKTVPSWRDSSVMVPVRNACQFSWFCDGKRDDIILSEPNGDIIVSEYNSWRQSVETSLSVVMGYIKDPTNGATHYFNHHIANPEWKSVYSLKKVLGNHSFYGDDTGENR